MWKAADEMNRVSVPRKAHSRSTKRSHECWASRDGTAAEQNHWQASTSPVRIMMTGAPTSSLSSNSVRKKIKANGGPKFRPPKSSSKSSSSAQEEIEIEIAEVLYGMMRQPQGPSKEEIIANDSVKFDSNKASSDAKSRISSPISNSQSAPPQNSSSSATPISAVGGFFQRDEVWNLRMLI